MFHRTLIAASTALCLGLASAAAPAQQATCPECQGTLTLNEVVAGPPVEFTSCPECMTTLGTASLTSITCDMLGGTTDGSQCKLLSGKLCPLDSLDSCEVAALPEEDWGEDPASSTADAAGGDDDQ